MLIRALDELHEGGDVGAVNAITLKEASEMPWYFGLDFTPPEGMTGQALLQVIEEQGGLGTTGVVLGG